jgi:hypothetical protein
LERRRRHYEINLPLVLEERAERTRRLDHAASAPLEDVKVARPAGRACQLDHVRDGAVDQPSFALRRATLSLHRQRDVRPIQLIAQTPAHDLAMDERPLESSDCRFRKLRARVQVLQAACTIRRQ